MEYWFKPLRFWKWCACYYPVSWQGWLVTLASAVFLVDKFMDIDRNSHSASDTLLSFALWVIGVGIIVDIISRLTGEGPSWWKKK